MKIIKLKSLMEKKTKNDIEVKYKEIMKQNLFMNNL